MIDRGFPSLEEMLESLLLIEEGEHEFTGEMEDEGAQDVRQLFFPVTRNCIYLNHASNGPLPRPVARTLHEYIDDCSAFGNMHSERWQMHGQGAHRRMANMINARPDQIAFTASTGDGLMMIAQGLPWQEGDTVVTSEGEFPSNIYPWLNLQAQGVQVHLAEARNHRVPPEAVYERIDEHTRLVSLSLVQFSTGYRSDIAAIVRYCHERGILCGIDAMQALGALDIDVQALGVDFLASAAHKWLLGTQTTGILYVADALLGRLHLPRRSWFSVAEPFDFFSYEQPLKTGAARFEHSSPNSTAIVGLDASLGVFEALDGGMQAVEARILGLTRHAITGLERLGYPVVSPQGPGERSGIVCFTPHPQRPDKTPQQIVDDLAARNIATAARGTVIRISPHFYNTTEEIDTLLNVLEEMSRRAQEMTEGRDMQFSFQLMDADDALAVLAWHYEEPYAVYNMGDDFLDITSAKAAMLDRRSPHYSVRNEAGELIGFFSYGTSAYVTDYGEPHLYSATQHHHHRTWPAARPDGTGQRVRPGLRQRGPRFRPPAVRARLLSPLRAHLQ